MIVSAAGPVTSLLFALLCMGATLWVQQGEWRSFFLGVAIFHFRQLLVTIIPVSYPRWRGSYGGTASDGLQILRHFRRGEMGKM